MEVKPKPPTAKGPAQTFTGDVWVDAIANGEEPSRVRVNLVRFSPGARSAWHWHGATPDDFMTHLSITEGVVNGEKPETDWGTHVTDAEYQGRGQ
jgi:quercetin dioxygenase-like cupin family protein